MRIAVGMSGGVDSSAAALLLVREGHEVEGVTMALGAEGQARESPARAARAARALGIPHTVIDVSGAFASCVVAHFVDEYAHGRTPNPCIRCNSLLKFGVLARAARDLGAAAFATGHYARIGEADGAFGLLRGADPVKDQSYFLYALTQQQLAFSRFPLGALRKDEVRAISESAGLSAPRGSESADACFVSDAGIGSFLRGKAPRATTPGPIVDGAGNRLGTHGGYGLYTIGQRSGLGLSRPEPSYVLRIEPATNTIVVGPDRDLFVSGLIAEGLSWVAGRPPARRFRAGARIRYAGRDAPCEVVLEQARALVRFEAPQRAVAPGQAVVFYDGDAVLGGGTIARELVGPPGEVLG